MKVLLVLAVVVAVAVAQSCPNDCSDHGTCHSGVCSCSSDYAGEDCSIPDKELQNNVVVHATVPIRQWQYYHIAVSGKPELVIEVNQTGSAQDCDTYVREGDYPNKQDFDQRDISTRRETHLVIPNPAGTYYIGVYGFLTTDYDISAIFDSDCLECSGHGTCDFDTNDNVICRCSEGYYGDDCSVNPDVMTNDTWVEGSVEKHAWVYYRIVNEHNAVEVFMNQSSTVFQDCDVYIKYNALPSLSDYDTRDTTTVANHDVKIPEALVGNYIYGVYGYKGCSYETMSQTYQECPNKCSGSHHGTCHEDTCACTSKYEGQACENMNSPLEIQVPEDGYVDTHNWNYYFFSVHTSADAYVNVVYSDTTQDCDLYIKQGDKPTTSDFDYREFTFRTNKTITIEDPVQGARYDIGVYGYRTCTYTLTYGLTYSCPNDCSRHGQCDDGHCLCNDGWGGDSCSSPTSILDNGVPTTGTVDSYSNVWSYYTFEVQPDYDVTILMKETNSTGYLWLYESRDDFPDQVSYDYADTETNSYIHDISFTPVNAETSYIGISTSPLAPSEFGYAYELEAYQAGFGGLRRSVKLTEVRR